MDPQALLDWLNVYMEAMAQLVMDHGGVVDNYIGNSTKADFGVPVPRTDEAAISRDAVAAVDWALGDGKRIKTPQRRLATATPPHRRDADRHFHRTRGSRESGQPAKIEVHNRR
jgi:adenylate cyclase